VILANTVISQWGCYGEFDRGAHNGWITSFGVLREKVVLLVVRVFFWRKSLLVLHEPALI
jgi:hypothetical protein